MTNGIQGNVWNGPIEAKAPEIGFALQSPGPHPDIPIEQRIFSPMIGSWDLDVIWYEDGAPIRREVGEWHFAWVLEGRAVQDVWIVPARRLRLQSAGLYEYGTSVRFYDRELGIWRSTWIGPMRALVRSFVARSDGPNVVLETADNVDRRLRWVFSELLSDSFTWQNFEEVQGGAFALVQSFSAVRTRAAGDETNDQKS